jgi:hypothetical protein
MRAAKTMTPAMVQMAQVADCLFWLMGGSCAVWLWCVWFGPLGAWGVGGEVRALVLPGGCNAGARGWV